MPSAPRTCRPLYPSSSSSERAGSRAGASGGGSAMPSAPRTCRPLSQKARQSKRARARARASLLQPQAGLSRLAPTPFLLATETAVSPRTAPSRSFLARHSGCRGSASPCAYFIGWRGRRERGRREGAGARSGILSASPRPAPSRSFLARHSGLGRCFAAAPLPLRRCYAAASGFFVGWRGVLRCVR